MQHNLSQPILKTIAAFVVRLLTAVAGMIAEYAGCAEMVRPLPPHPPPPEPPPETPPETLAAAPTGMRFDPALAKVVGEGAAAMFETFKGWIAYNMTTHGTNETYRSAQDWCEKEFTWMTVRQFRDRLKKLEAANLITVKSGRGGDRRLRITLGVQLAFPFGAIEKPKTSHGGRKTSNDSNSSINKASKQAAAAENKPTTEDKRRLQEGAEVKRGDDDVADGQRGDSTPIPDDVRAFYHSVSATELAKLPAEAWRWGMHEYDLAKGRIMIATPIGFAVAAARKWNGQVVDDVKSLPPPAPDVPPSAEPETQSADDLFAGMRALQEEWAAKAAPSVDVEPPPAWFGTAKNQLSRQLDNASFMTLARDMHYVGLDDGQVVVCVPSATSRDQLQGRYYRDVRRALRDAHPDGAMIEFKVIVAVPSVADEQPALAVAA